MWIIYLNLVLSICISMTGQTTSANPLVAANECDVSLKGFVKLIEDERRRAIKEYERIVGLCEYVPQPSVTLELFHEVPYDYLTVEEVLKQLEGYGELLEPEEVLLIVGRERYGILELFDGITANQLLGMNKWTTFDCKREAFETLLNQCDSWDKRKAKSSPNKKVMENLRYFCRRVLHERAANCELVRGAVLRDEVTDEKFLDDLRDETDKYLVDERKGIDLKGEYLYKRTSLEELIGGPERSANGTLDIPGPEEDFDRLNEAHYNTKPANQQSAIGMNPELNFDLPDEMDWRVIGSRVTSVKDQGKFSTGVAFAVAGSLEGWTVLASTVKELADLSVQNVIDCSNNTQDPFVAFSTVLKEGGIQADSDYPYEGSVSKCRFDISKSLITFDSVALPENNEKVLRAVTWKFGPVTAGVSTRGWQNYKSGVFDGPDCGEDIDATVLIVGYGTDPKLGHYWLVKNSLSEKWGGQGYMRLQRGAKRFGTGSQITYPWYGRGLGLRLLFTHETASELPIINE